MTTSNLVAFGQVLAATSTLSSELASDGLESEPSSDSAPMDVTSAFRHLGYRRTRTFPVLPTEKKPQPEASFKPFELVNIAAFNAGTQNHFQDGGQGRHITRAKARNVAISETRSAVLIRLAAIRREAQIESMSYSYDSEQDLRVFVVDGLKPTTRPTSG